VGFRGAAASLFHGTARISEFAPGADASILSKCVAIGTRLVRFPALPGERYGSGNGLCGAWRKPHFSQRTREMGHYQLLRFGANGLFTSWEQRIERSQPGPHYDQVPVPPPVPPQVPTPPPS